MLSDSKNHRRILFWNYLREKAKISSVHPNPLLNIISEKSVSPAIIWVLCLKKQINTLTVDWQEICFVSFFIPASLFAMEMNSWSDSLCSFQFSCSLTCATSNFFPKWKKKVIPRYDSAPSNLHVGQGLWIFEDKGILKVHCIISKIFIILVWRYILLNCRHLLMAVTIQSPWTQAPCISLRHLVPFFLQTWHLEDHYMTYIDNCYKVLSRLNPALA